MSQLAPVPSMPIATRVRLAALSPDARWLYIASWHFLHAARTSGRVSKEDVADLTSLREVLLEAEAAGLALARRRLGIPE